MVFNPTYNSRNQITSFGETFDSMGNTTKDNLGNNYSYDAEGRPVTLPGVTQAYYDAFNRPLTLNRSGTYTNFAYAPTGQRFAVVNGSTLQNYYLPIAGGVLAVYNASGLQYYRHADWLGSSRFGATPSGTVQYSLAYAPFGETYYESGSVDRSFTGQTQDVVQGQTGIYDFLFRQHASSQGRWLVPDPAGLAAVDLTNPQTWNRYAYVANNPLNDVDPLGLIGNCPAGSGQNIVNSDGTTSCGPAPGDWQWLAFEGWPGTGSSQEFFCMLMGGCSGGSTGSGGGASVQTQTQPKPQPPSSGTQPKTQQPQVDVCTPTILSAVNGQFGTNATSDNIQGDAFPNGQATNLIIQLNGLPAAQFNSIQTGRYPLNWWSYVIGYGPTLHVTGRTQFDPPPATFQNSNIGGLTSVTFTAHIDTSFAYNPFGFLIHVLRDLLHIGGPRNPC